MHASCFKPLHSDSFVSHTSLNVMGAEYQVAFTGANLTLYRQDFAASAAVAPCRDT